MTFESTAVSRTRSASAAVISPSPVQEKAATRMTSASAGIESEAGMSTPRISEPTTSEKAATNAPFTTSPERRGRRRAGDAAQG